MRKISLFLFLIIFFTFLSVLGQNQTEISEIHIKRSGIFFWGQAYHVDSVQAILESRDALIAQITEEIDNDSKLNSNSDIFVQSIKYFPKELEGVFKVIAYVEKDLVQNVISENPSLNIVNIKYSDHSEKQIDFTENSTIIDYDSSSNFIDEESQNSWNEENQNVTLLDRFIQCDTGMELRDLILSQESKNTIFYNWNSRTYQEKVSPAPFYIALIDPETRAIVAFLDKGNEVRKNLKAPYNSFKINYELKKYIQVWIQIL